VGHRWVVNFEVSKRECGEREGRKFNLRSHRAGVVQPTLRTVGVDDREASGGRVKEAVRGEELQCHNITPAKQLGQKRNS